MPCCTSRLHERRIGPLDVCISVDSNQPRGSEANPIRRIGRCSLDGFALRTRPPERAGLSSRIAAISFRLRVPGTPKSPRESDRFCGGVPRRNRNKRDKRLVVSRESGRANMPTPISRKRRFTACLTPHGFLTQSLGQRHGSAWNRALWQ